MIDRFGNKLRPPKKGNYNPTVVSNEVRFLMKGFAADPTDRKALYMAQKGEWLAEKLSSLLDVSGSVQLLESVILALDPYCARSRNADAVWYMGWLCRSMYYSITAGLYKKTPEDYIAYSCRFFERYEQLRPTDQGRTLLVNVCCVYADKLERDKVPDAAQKALAVLERARASEERIDPGYTRSSRFLVCQVLYTHLYELYKRLDRQPDALCAVQRSILYLWKTVCEKADNSDLRKLAHYCLSYTEHPLYDSAADPVPMDAIIACFENNARLRLSAYYRHVAERLKNRIRNSDT